jgi:hypothetical protein
MTSLAFAVAFSGSALAQENAATATTKGMGVQAGLNVTYAAPNKQYDFEGNDTDLEEVTAMVVNLNAEYDLTSAGVAGLFLGLDLPFVQNKFGDASGSGLGDASFYAGYMMPINDGFKVGGKLRFKAATGNSEPDPGDLATGSGANNIQISALGKGSMNEIKYGFELGYLMTMEDKNKVNGGDYIYADIGAGYTVSEMITPMLHILYATSGDDSVDGTSAPDTGSSWFALALDVGIKVNEMIEANIGLGTNLQSAGLNLPYGAVLSGKNTVGGFTAINAGVTAHF